jgi:hypothetical protein
MKLSVTWIEIHIGNSDVLGHVVYNGGKELLNLIASIKSMEAVDKVVWSERVYQSPPKVNSSILTLLNNDESQQLEVFDNI